MGLEHPELAVDRHHRLRPDEAEQRAHLLGARVARDVDRRVLLVQHLRSVSREAVDRVVHAQLVPRHRACRHDHRVATLDPDGRVVVVGDPRQRRERLALRARAENQLPPRLELVQVDRPHEQLVGRPNVVEVARDVQVLLHRAADHRDLAVDLGRHVDRLLHAVDVRGERGDQDAAGALRDDLTERLADDALGAREPGPLGVGRVAEQKIDAAVPELGELADVGAQPVDRRVVELPVSGVEDAAGGGLDRDADGVGDRVRHAHELEPKRAEVERRSLRVDLAQLRRALEAVLVELRADHAERQACRPHLLDSNLTEEVRQRADVILVRVREHDGTDLTVAEVAEVRQDEVDAEVLVTWEREPRVDDERLSGDLEHRHVLADLAEAAERDHPQHRVRHRSKHTAR